MRTLLLINLILLCIVLYAGLTPFHAPRNDVAWASNSNGVQFGDHGVIVSVEPVESGPGVDGHSLEIWMQPGQPPDSGTLLAFYDPKEARGFGLHQSVSDLELRVEPWLAWRPAKISTMYVDNALRDGSARLWTVSLGPSGATIYRDGVKLQESRSFIVSDREFSGQLVLGTTPTSNDSWSGILRGLAIYSRQLTADQIARHTESWTRTGAPQISGDDACIALYLFDERAGTVVHNVVHNLFHNRVASGTDLRIPANYMLVNATVLDPVWRAFNWSWGFWQDTLINIFGFVPVGFFLCAYFAARGVGRPALTASAVGCAISLFIELVQVFLPTRDSSMSDLITNTLGSLIGAFFYLGKACRFVARRIPG